jgi:cell wall hydrolase
MTHDELELVMALTEPQVLALTIFGEARGEPIEGRIAVASVIRNRVNAKHYGASFRDVCLKPWQFSCWLPQGGPQNYETVLAAARQFVRVDGKLGPDLRECVWIADGTIADTVRDRVKGATHYATFEILASAKPPAWAKGFEPVCTVGHHAFFKGIR